MSTIEWTDETWNPVVGCTRVSAGCDHCYAMGVAHRKMSPAHHGLTKLRPKDASRPGIDWNGTVRTLPDVLAKPLHWRKPRRVFVNSMSDLFHEAVPFEFIAAVFGVMAACPQHTFQVLTKRPARMREFFAWCHVWEGPRTYRFPFGECAVNYDIGCTEEMRRAIASHPNHTNRERDLYWPLPNVHLGVSVEDQATADERIPILLDCPATVHWISAEPLLGPLDIAAANVKRHIGRPQLRWVVVGGESGPSARQFEIEWAREVVRQCAGAGVPVFVKQLGARPTSSGRVMQPMYFDPKGKDPSHWPADLRVREMPT